MCFNRTLNLVLLLEMILSDFKVNVPFCSFWLFYCPKMHFWKIGRISGWAVFNDRHSTVSPVFRGACMSSSSSITTRPAGCVFSSWPSLRPSASPGSTVRAKVQLKQQILGGFLRGGVSIKGGLKKKKGTVSLSLTRSFPCFCRCRPFL